jgi:tyrosyl-tRNA synthetase
MKPEQQLELLEANCVDLITREQLLHKLDEGRPLRIKYGADPSAPDLHLGHSIPLRKLKQFQDLGHQVIFIIGDFTGRIGDPSGRTKTRPILTDEEIQANAETYVEQVGQILDVDRCEIVYNSSWFSDMTATDLLNLASQYSVARMLERDDFALRLENEIPITVLELLYPLIQAYDSVQVEADVELGGTDQLFNFLVGRNIMRSYGLEPQVVMTLDLLVGTDGKQKMSKSLGNYVGITEQPGEMFGKLMSIPDELMHQYHDLLLEPPGLFREDPSIDPAHISAELERRVQETPRYFKADLAEAVVTMYHSQEAATNAREEFDRVFSAGQQPSDMPDLPVSASVRESVSIVELVLDAEFAASKSEARRLVRQKAVSINDEVITDEMAEVEVASGDVLRVGRRRFARIQIQ